MSFYRKKALNKVKNISAEQILEGDKTLSCKINMYTGFNKYPMGRKQLLYIGNQILRYNMESKLSSLALKIKTLANTVI